MKKITAICLLSGLVAITAASTSISVAWYSTASFLSVEEINVTLSSSSPLLIGTEKSGPFHPALEYDDLKKVDAFAPVTGINIDDWFDEGADYPVLYESYTSRATTIVTTEDNIYAQPYDKEATEGFYSQELFLYAENDYYATIKTDETIFEPNLYANWARAEKLAKDRGEKTREEYYEDLNKLVDSIRFSVLVDTPLKYDYKVFDPNKNQESTKLGGLVDTSMMGTFDAAGFGDSRCETIYGEVNDRNLIVYRDEPDQSEIIGKHTWYNAKHDPTAKQIDFDKSYANGLEIKTEDALSLNEYQAIKEKVLGRTATQEEIDSMLLIPLKTMVPTRIVLSIYFEGFDLDSINETMASSFTSKIVFDVIDWNII